MNSRKAIFPQMEKLMAYLLAIMTKTMAMLFL
jgi:hypothetical protein